MITAPTITSAPKNLLLKNQQPNQESLYEKMLTLQTAKIENQADFLETYGFFLLNGDYMVTEFKKDQILDSIIRSITLGYSINDSLNNLDCIPRDFIENGRIQDKFRQHLVSTSREEEYRTAHKIASLWLVDDMIKIEAELKDKTLDPAAANVILSSLKFRLTNLNRDFRLRQEIEIHQDTDISSKIELLEKFGITIDDIDQIDADDEMVDEVEDANDY